MPEATTLGKPTIRRYGPEEMAAGVRVVRALRVEQARCAFEGTQQRGPAGPAAAVEPTTTTARRAAHPRRRTKGQDAGRDTGRDV